MAYQFDILSCAPENVTLRDVQVKALLWVQENWEKLKVIILNMPVGAGKSIVAMTICEWIKRNGLGKAATITPTKILQDQYGVDFTWIPMLKGMENYTCHATPAGNCRATKRIFDKCCGPSCPYLVVKNACYKEPVSLYNFHSYHFNKMWKDTVIIDEGHNASNFLFDMYSLKLWQPDWNYDKEIDPTLENVSKIVADALADLSERYAQALSKKMDKLAEELENEVRRYSNVMQCLNNWGKDVLIVKKEEEYKAPKGKRELKGTKQIMINIKPLKVSSFAAEVLWPSDMTGKVILMSATISMNDAEELGLTKDVGYFESESPIPKERRPFVVLPVANMGWAAQHESIPIIADYLLKLAARHPNEKGIIHCTYSVAKALEKILGRNSRFWFHDNMNKVDVYQRFRTEKGNAILVASGMAEGIDLPDDAARWQAITKVQWPSLADDVNQWRAHNAPRLYQWDTVRTIIQQSGRICRGPKDYGVTYMLDEAFTVLWNRTKDMWPQWFKEAMVWVKA